jgi:tRNA1(Val) A37 N6-methylase TrmN6
LNEELLVRQTTKHSPFRGIMLYGTKKESYASNELIIKDDDGKYTTEFNLLLKDYYL